jgi:hypothetical protein
MSEVLNISSALARALQARGKADDRAMKKNFAEALSRELAQIVADRLRKRFQGILPSATGASHESPARTEKGKKKLDVNFSTPELGLGLGVSIKTVTSSDPKSRRFTKNFTRIDNELRAEAMDYHQRQPFSVMIALVFLPESACLDAGKKSPSSFGSAVKCFRYRCGRSRPTDDPQLFESIYIACYGDSGTERQGETWFFDAMRAPPRSGRPVAEERLTFSEVVTAIESVFEARNEPRFEWSDRHE